MCVCVHLIYRAKLKGVAYIRCNAAVVIVLTKKTKNKSQEKRAEEVRTFKRKFTNCRAQYR